MRSRDRGYPLSALYPYTAPMYRALGWEFGGRRYETVLPASALATFPSPDRPGQGGPTMGRRCAAASPADAEAIVEVKGLVHERLRHCGPNTREPGCFAAGWTTRITSPTWPTMASSATAGLTTWTNCTSRSWSPPRRRRPARSGGSWPRTRTWSTRVRACLGPDDPVSWLTRDADAELRQQDGWMLRVVDAPAAIAGRGYRRRCQRFGRTGHRRSRPA